MRKEDYFSVLVEIYDDEEEIDVEMKALMRSALDGFQEYIKYNRHLPAEAILV